MIIKGLTSWAASEDQLTDFIIDEDEQGVRECTEPPVGPGKNTQKLGMKHWFSTPGVSEEHVEPQSREDTAVGFKVGEFHSLQRVHSEGNIHAGAVGKEGSQGGLLKQSKDQDLVPERHVGRVQI